MLPTRAVPGQSSAVRKSRLEGRPSLLPKPCRPGSTDRLSTEARRPSTTGVRSSSAEPRSTIGGCLSRESSATNLPINKRARSQQGERFGMTPRTPLRTTQMSIRSTTTPRTPSEEHRNWKTSLEKALAFVTIKDMRPISTMAWQRAEAGRVGAALAARGGGAPALMKPLTIARFVEIVGALLDPLAKDFKLNNVNYDNNAKLSNDNYVTKLPILAKMLLYPGTVTKSWLKTVNTLHAFPQALALISYLLDMVNHIEMPVSPEWMYVAKDELSCLRREYMYMSFLRFQEMDTYDDLNEQYLRNLKALLGNDDEKITQLKQEIKEYSSSLEDEEEAAARAEEARRAARRDGLAAAARAARAACAAARAACAAQRRRREDAKDLRRRLELEAARASTENQQLHAELENQSITVAERSRLLDEVDYANRVADSKLALVEQTAKMLQSKEVELALWQKKSLSACVEFKQGLTHLAGQFPHLAALAIDENELMSTECASRMSGAVEELRACSATLAERRAQHVRNKTALARKQAARLEESRRKISELKASVCREQQALDSETAQEASDVTAWSEELQTLTQKTRDLQQKWPEYEKADKDLEFWEKQAEAWRTKLSAMREYIDTQRAESQRLLKSAREKRVLFVADKLKQFAKVLED